MSFAHDVFCPFRLSVPEGKSTFIVPVPRQYSSRQFYFSELTLAPDYYNIKSAIENMDTDQELNALTFHEISLTVKPDPEKLFGKGFSLKNERTVTEFVKSVNTFFENNKPNCIKRSVYFFDWISQEQEASDLTLDEFVRDYAENLYGEPYNPAKHFNALPASVRKGNPAFNNYLYPTTQVEAIVETLRWRMWIGPNTTVTFSTDQQLIAMGFSEEQLGPRQGSGKKFVFTNATAEYMSIKAEWETSPAFEYARCDIKLIPTSANFTSPDVSFVTAVKDTYNNATLKTKVGEAVKKLSEQSNTTLAFDYDATTSIFKFTFPANTFYETSLNVSPEFGPLLGFGFVDHIDKDSVASPRPDKIDVKEAGEKSRTLSFDTGLVIVEANQKTSNTTSVLDNQFMAALFPNESGILTFQAGARLVTTPATTTVPLFATGSNRVPLEFKLSRFIADNVLVPLVWKTGAFVNGVLVGKSPSTSYK